jgi:hypothetical protein
VNVVRLAPFEGFALQLLWHQSDAISHDDDTFSDAGRYTRTTAVSHASEDRVLTSPRA